LDVRTRDREGLSGTVGPQETGYFEHRNGIGRKQKRDDRASRAIDGTGQSAVRTEAVGVEAQMRRGPTSIGKFWPPINGPSSE
jgi:hypothetical protein